MTRFIAVLCSAAALATMTAATKPAPAPPPKAAPPRAVTTIELPGDAGMTFQPGPGVGAVTSNCLGCHSSAYVSTQPVLSRMQWTAEVTKMRTAYGAPIRDDVVPTIVDYLTAQYGRP